MSDYSSDEGAATAAVNKVNEPTADITSPTEVNTEDIERNEDSPPRNQVSDQDSIDSDDDKKSSPKKKPSPQSISKDQPMEQTPKKRSRSNSEKRHSSSSSGGGQSDGNGLSRKRFREDSDASPSPDQKGSQDSKKKKSKKDKKKKKRNNSSSSESADQESEDTQDAWSAHDENVDYGEAELLSDCSVEWECRSQELYDSDNPECPLNAYHIESRPRLVQLQETNDKGDTCKLLLSCLHIPSEAEQRQSYKKSNIKNLQTKKEEIEIIDHYRFQSFGMVPNNEKTTEMALHNMISLDFIRGVQKAICCPICQDMISNPVIYKQCVHRFCSNCIETYNRQGKKECPLCRVAIQNRRQLRPDKNIQKLISVLTEEFRKLARQEELENLEIRRKIICEQKKLKEKKDKQKRIVTNEMKRKYGESRDERDARLKIERAQGIKRGGRWGNGSGGGAPSENAADSSMVQKMLEEKIQMLKQPNFIQPLDIEIVLKHDQEQSRLIQGVFVKRIRLVSSRLITLVHLAILVCTQNSLREDEWPNFEFIPCLKDNKIPDASLKKLFLNGTIRPFGFRETIQDICEKISGGEIKSESIMKIELVYKKKPLPQISARNNIVQGMRPPFTPGQLQGAPMPGNPMGGPMSNFSFPGSFNPMPMQQQQMGQQPPQGPPQMAPQPMGQAQ